MLRFCSRIGFISKLGFSFVEFGDGAWRRLSGFLPRCWSDSGLVSVVLLLVSVVLLLVPVVQLLVPVVLFSLLWSDSLRCAGCLVLCVRCLVV